MSFSNGVDQQNGMDSKSVTATKKRSAKITPLAPPSPLIQLSNYDVERESTLKRIEKSRGELLLNSPVTQELENIVRQKLEGVNLSINNSPTATSKSSPVMMLKTPSSKNRFIGDMGIGIPYLLIFE